MARFRAANSCRSWLGCLSHPQPVLCVRHSVDYLYSLYDALVSINVPNDKARAVVDAMERDMGTTIATKADLNLLRQEMTTLATRSDLAELRQECALIRKDMELMAARLKSDLVLQMGSMNVVLAGLLFAALKLT